MLPRETSACNVGSHSDLLACGEYLAGLPATGGPEQVNVEWQALALHDVRQSRLLSRPTLVYY